MIMLDVVQQLNIDVFCPLIYNRAKQADSQEEFRMLMEKEITKEGLQWINDAARVDGFQPISSAGKQ